MYRGHPQQPRRREPQPYGELPQPTTRARVNVCSFVLLCALAITGGAVWALLSERSALQREMTELRRVQTTQRENHEREATNWRQEVQKALKTPVKTSYNASAFFCCFDGPAWMQKRYTVMLGNALNALPPSVKVQVFHRGDSSWERGLHLNPGVDRLKQTHGLRLSFHELPLRIRKAKRSDVLLSYDLWNTLDAEIVLACVEIKILRRVRAKSSRPPPRHRRDACSMAWRCRFLTARPSAPAHWLISTQVLAFGSGGAFCSNALVHFEDFASFELIDGDGLLLTRKSAVLDVIKHKSGSSNCRCIEGKHGPTRYLASQLTSGGALDAPRKVKEHFAASSQTADDALPFAVVGTLPAMDAAKRSDLIERCPEAKAIFPSLHEPGCFGAPSALDKDRCVASLCVSNPRPSGC